MSDLSSRVAELSSRFMGALLLPDNPAWDVARRVHNGFVNKQPTLVAQCRGSADIALAVRFARDAGLEIAVRGGGHNVGGRSTIDDGLLIDLSQMQYVYVDSAARKALAREAPCGDNATGKRRCMALQRRLVSCRRHGCAA